MTFSILVFQKPRSVADVAAVAQLAFLADLAAQRRELVGQPQVQVLDVAVDVGHLAGGAVPVVGKLEGGVALLEGGEGRQKDGHLRVAIAAQGSRFQVCLPLGVSGAGDARTDWG